MDSRRRLVKAVREHAQIGLVLGAGVSVGSGVPDYARLATRVLELADDQGLIGAGASAHDDLLNGRVPSDEMPPPDEILSYVRSRIATGGEFHRLVREALYRDVKVPSNRRHEQQWAVEDRTWTKHRTIATEIFRENSTLDAVIRFCAAEPGSSHARRSTDRARAATNRHVGAIVTTNYDNLVEASFGTKYLKSLLRPVGRFPIHVGEDGIPVFHCHGYVSYPPPRDSSELPYSPLLIAEEDYYAASYDTRSFGNTVLAYVLQRMPCLFIGSAMTDRNLRRHLLTRVAPDHEDRSTAPREHFAILRKDEPLDGFTDAVLARYRVCVIRIDEFSMIPELLRELYVSADGVVEDDWQWTQLSEGERRRRRATNAPGDE